MAIESSVSLQTSTLIISLRNEYQHLHGVEVDSLNVDGSWIHVHCRAIRISLPRHLMESSSCKINVSCIEKSHHPHRMMRRTHDGRRCLARRRPGHWLLNVRFVRLHGVLFSRRRRRCRWRTHIRFGLYSTFNARPTDWIASLFKL